MTLADSLYKRSEGDGFLDICVLPRIDIQQEIEFQLTVNELTALEGSDFNSPAVLGGTFTVGGQPEICFTFTITDDDCVEDEESFQVVVSYSSDADIDLNNYSAIVIIWDNDYAVFNVSEDVYYTEENARFFSVCIELIDGCLQREVNIDLNILEGTATDGSDFFSNNHKLIFENGSISGTVECTNLEIIDDTIKEGNESFALVFCPGGDEAVHLQDHSATVHIIDDDRVNVTLSLGNPAGTVSEGNGAMLVLVELEGEIDTDVRVTLQIYDGSAVAGSDYVPVTKEIIFNSYSQNPHRVYIPIINDDDDCVEENEYFSVKINTDMECVDLPVDLVNITILDNDIPEVALVSMFTEVTESDTVVSVCVELKSNLKRDIDIYLDVVGDSATAGEDFNGTSPLKQIFPSGSNAGDRKYFDIQIFDDDIVEKDESFSVVLRDTGLIVHDKTSHVQIIDDDTACVNFSQSVYEVQETSGSVDICIELDGTLEDYLTVYLFTIPGTATDADFSPLNENLTFHSDGRQCVRVVIITGDDVEDTEKFSVILSTQDKRVDIKRYYASINIVDDNAIAVVARWEQAQYSICEGAPTISVCVTIAGEVENDISITLATGTSGTAIAGEDYVAKTENFNFANGDTPPCLNINILDDSKRESCDQTFTVVLTTSDSNVFVALPTAAVTIYDNEEPRIEFVDNTPDVTGTNITSQYQTEGCINGDIPTTCSIGRNGEPFTCPSPFSFTRDRSGSRRMRISVSGFCGNNHTLTRTIRSDNIRCDIHQINGGEEEATVVGNTATVMFEGTGPSADNVVTDFDLRIRRERETEPGVFDNVVVGPTCSTAATQTPPPFTMTCSVDNAGHGEVTVSGFDSSGRWEIFIQPIQPSSGLQCRNLMARTYEFEIQVPM